MNRDKSKGLELGGELSRRKVLTAALLGAAAPAGLFLGTAMAATPLVPIDANDAQAKALGYVADSSKVDAKANPNHKPDQKCSRCLQFQGTPADKQAGCNIFPGKAVSAGGWCKVWTLKPGS
jgi:hypothetical protein